MTSTGETTSDAARLAPELLVPVEIEPASLVDFAARCAEDRAAWTRLRDFVYWLLHRSILVWNDPADWRRGVFSASAEVPGELHRQLDLERLLVVAPGELGSVARPTGASVRVQSVEPTSWEQDAACMPPPIVRMDGRLFLSTLSLLAQRTTEVWLLDRYAASYNSRASDAWLQFGLALLAANVGRLEVWCACGGDSLPPNVDAARKRILELLNKAAREQLDPAIAVEVRAFETEAFALAAHERFLALFEGHMGHASPRWLFWLGKGIQSLTDEMTTVGLMHPSLFADIRCAIDTKGFS